MMHTTDFFNLIFGQNTNGFVNIWVRTYSKNIFISNSSEQHFNTSTFFLFPEEIRKAAKFALKKAAKGDVYFSVCLLKEPPENGRGTEKSVSSLHTLWMDIDIGEIGHKKTHYPKDKEEATRILSKFPIEPSIVVDSGNGLPVYYLLEKPLIIENKNDYFAAKQLVKDFQLAINTTFNSFGFQLDITADLARVIRVPGTSNYKNRQNIIPVSLLYAKESNRYSAEKIKEISVNLIGEKSEGNRSYPNKRMSNEVTLVADNNYCDSFSNANFKEILECCAWFQHCLKDAKTLSENEWFFMLVICTKCSNGYDYAHKMSEKYPDYSETQTNTYFERAKNYRSPSCKYLRENFGYLEGNLQCSYCCNCSHWGIIRNPVFLGT